MLDDLSEFKYESGEVIEPVVQRVRNQVTLDEENICVGG